MTDDRSERLRKRRRQSMTDDGRTASQTGDRRPTRNDGNGSHPSTPDSHPEQSAPSGDIRSGGETARTDGSAVSETAGSENGTEDGTVSVKEEQTGTYMYLPKSQTKQLRRLYNVLKAEYEFEYDEEFEKNRHFYPLVIQYGLDELDGMDASDIRTRLEAMR